MRSLVHHCVFCFGLLLVLVGFRWWIAVVPETPAITPPEVVAQEWRLFLEYLHRRKEFAGEIGLHPLGFAGMLTSASLIWLRFRSDRPSPNVTVSKEAFCNQS